MCCTVAQLLRFVIITATASLLMVPAAHADKCVFRAPFDEAQWYERAAYGVDLQYQLVNYTVEPGRCFAARPATDRLGRPGWRRVRCIVTLAGQQVGTQPPCYVRDSFRHSDGPCTGTIWQLGPQDPRDLKATRLRFVVVLLQPSCAVGARIRQIAPFQIRVKKPVA